MGSMQRHMSMWQTMLLIIFKKCSITNPTLEISQVILVVLNGVLWSMKGCWFTDTVKHYNLSHTLAGNKIVEHSDVTGASPVSALLDIWAGNSTGGPIPTQRPVTLSFDVFFDLRLNERLSKQWWGWWFETLSCPLWRHCSVHSKTQRKGLSDALYTYFIVIQQYRAPPIYHIEAETRWPPIWHTTFLNAFPRMKTLEFYMKFHWNMFLMDGLIDNMADLV